MPSETGGRVHLGGVLTQVKACAAAGDHRAAFMTLRDCIAPDAAFVDQARVARALSTIDLSGLDLRPLRIALLAASTMDHLAGVLRFWLARAGFNAEILVTPFGTQVQAALEPDSALPAFRPDIVWLFSTFRDVDMQMRPDAEATGIRAAVDRAVAARVTLWRSLAARLSCVVMDNTADIPVDDPFGNLAGAAPWGRRTLLRRYNVALTEAAPPGVVLFDLDNLSGTLGRGRWTDPRYWHHSKHAFALDASGPLAHAASRVIAASRGLAKKCLVLDLDNTLWGGVIGDDGLAGLVLGAGEDGEAFVAFQTFIRALRDRGIILAACSKNEPETAQAVFRDHPDTVLRLEDFAVFNASWDNKADSVRDIARRLNIGLDTLVFVDDNKLERDIVRRHLPEVEVVDLPDDPCAYTATLARAGWFEAASFSAEDAERGRYYAENARRDALREGMVDMDAYLASLDMAATVGEVDRLHLPRIAQLINKSNQFHLTGTRYSEADILRLAAEPGRFIRHVRVRDRFGDNGLIACVILKRQDSALHIDTWVMSCRVLGRTVEEFIANEILAIARANRCDTISARYVRLPKNKLVAGLYQRLGFTLTGETDTETWWTRPVDTSGPGWKTWVHAGVESRSMADASA